MIAIARQTSPGSTLTNAHDAFLAMLPTIKRQAQLAFRGQLPEAREDLVQEVVANAFTAFARLVQRGKRSVAYATPLANYAIRQVRTGRCVGGRLNVRDVSSRYAQRSKGIAMERLSWFDSDEGEWREALIEDHRAGPADTAAARIDVAAWFRTLSRRDRRIAQALARGDSTRAAATKFRLSDGRVSQLRRELAASWSQFQGEPAAVA